MRSLCGIIRDDRIKVLEQGGVDTEFDAVCARARKHGYEVRHIEVSLKGAVVAHEVTFRRLNFEGTKKCQCLCCYAEQHVVIAGYNFKEFAKASRADWDKVAKLVTYCTSRSYL